MAITFVRNHPVVSLGTVQITQATICAGIVHMLELRRNGLLELILLFPVEVLLMPFGTIAVLRLTARPVHQLCNSLRKLLLPVVRIRRWQLVQVMVPFSWTTNRSTIKVGTVSRQSRILVHPIYTLYISSDFSLLIYSHYVKDPSCIVFSTCKEYYLFGSFWAIFALPHFPWSFSLSLVPAWSFFDHFVDVNKMAHIYSFESGNSLGRLLDTKI